MKPSRPLAGTGPATGRWVELSEVARIKGGSVRALRLWIARRRTGNPPRGERVVFRTMHGRGGSAGLRIELLADSLPEGLRQRLFETTALVPADAPALPAPTRRPRSTDLALWRYEVIRPALEHPPGSAERKAALLSIAKGSRRSRKRLSVRTIYRWIAAYERRGLAGLVAREKPDRGRPRVTISRAWDNIPFPEDVRAEIAEQLRRRVAGMHTKGQSRQVMIDAASRRLAELTRAAGFDHPALATICTVPRALIESLRNYRILHYQKHDAHWFYSNAAPRTRRDWTGLKPLDVVCADVYHVDVLYRRADGSLATPKAIAFLDMATRRLFIELVFLGPGAGVRQEYVARAFARMVEAWGVPSVLLIDNGGEFARLVVVEDAMRLAAKLGRDMQVRFSDDPQLAARIAGRRSQLIKARPYNPAAKPIEGIFSNLVRTILTIFNGRGYIGGNRMTKKTANLGRPPAPFPGTQDELRAAFAECVKYYEGRPQRGHLAGKSPIQEWNEAVDGGLELFTAPADVLSEAFAIDVVCKVRQCEVRARGVSYAARELGTILPGTKVIARVDPGHPGEALILDEKGAAICRAQAVKRHGALDPAGAIDQARRAKEQRVDLRRIWAEVDGVEPIEEIRKVNATRPKALQPASAGRLSLDARHESLAAARKALPAPSDARPVNRGALLWEQQYDRKRHGG